jgi:anti-sigma factor ChrR (cupin superfamily)
MNRADLRLDELLARSSQPDFAWQPFLPGVEIHRVWGDEKADSGALLRYVAGGSVPLHRHEGVEHIYVLRGSQRDERGVYPAGTHVVNPPGSIHAVESSEGCVVLVVWERPNSWVVPEPPSARGNNDTQDPQDLKDLKDS